MKIPRIIRLIALISTLALSGCMALPLVGMASVGLTGAMLYNTSNPDKEVDITIDEGSLNNLRANVSKLGHIAILGPSSTAVAFSDVWEGAGRQATIIAGDSNPTAVSLSQAQRLMRTACKGNVAAAAYGKQGATDVNRMGYLIGKASATIEMDLHVFNCRSKKSVLVPIVVKFNIIGQDPNALESAVGKGLAHKLLEITTA